MPGLQRDFVCFGVLWASRASSDNPVLSETFGNVTMPWHLTDCDKDGTSVRYISAIGVIFVRPRPWPVRTRRRNKVPTVSDGH